MPQRKLRRANHLALAGTLALATVMGLLTWHQFNLSRHARLRVQHTYEVLGTIQKLETTVKGAEARELGFLLTGEEVYLRPYEQARGHIAFLQSELRRLTADNPSQQNRLRVLAPLVEDKLQELDRAVRGRVAVSPGAAPTPMQRGSLGTHSTERVEASLAAMMAEERHLLDERLAKTDREAARTRWLALGGGLVAIGMLIAAARLLRLAQKCLLYSEAEQSNLARQLRTSLDSISQGVGVFDVQHCLVRWNRCFPALLGIPERLMWVGMSYAALTQAAPPGTTILDGADHLPSSPGERTEHGTATYERTCAAEGQSFEVRRTVMPGGGFVITLSDNTERSWAEAALREGQRLRAIGQLTGGIAHDFNNLLSIVMGNLDLVISQLEKGSPHARHLARAMWGVERGAALTQQLLAFARKQPLEPQPIDLAAMLPVITNLLRQTLGEHIEVHAPDADGLWPALADASQVESAILNLALNARDAMPDGGRLTLEVASKVLDDTYARHRTEVVPGDYVMVAVSDTGTGMTPDVLARAFEPFFTTKGVGKGTGLGLAMVFGFARQSNGHVEIYSEPGKGTTVQLYLPRATDSTQPVRRRVSASTELPRGSGTVLVVEDEPAVRDVTAAILGDLDYRVLEAANGPEALAIFKENADAIDLLLADVVLPGGMKGNEVARRITDVEPEVRVLFMSGYSENAIVHHGRLDPGVHLISKPFQRWQLAGKVAEVLGAHSMRVSDGPD